MEVMYQAIVTEPETLTTEEKKIALEEAIQRLSYDQRVVINYHFFDNLSQKMISLQLNCSETSVHTQIKKALYILRKQLNPSFNKKAMEILYGHPQNREL